MAFDCSVDLTARHPIPAEVPPSAAAGLVRTGIEALPGARWISFDWCGDAPPDLPWLGVYAVGDCREKSGGICSNLANGVRMTVLRTLSAAKDT